jgi:PIN domain nuclease of toxin-antitoxin system
VSGYLLDTNAALIALTDPDRLSSTARRAILSGSSVMSVVSYWEVLLKCMKGNLHVGVPRTWWHDALDQLGATPLMLRPEHVSVVYSLPPIHRDPFDRMLIAQAISEDLRFVTTDEAARKYTSAGLRVVPVK